MMLIKKYFMIAAIIILAGCIKKRIKTDALCIQEDKNVNHSEKIVDTIQEDTVAIQSVLEMATDAVIMIGTQSGSSMANQAVGTQRQMLISQINKNSQAIQSNMHLFQKKIQKNQQTELESMTGAFGNAQQNVQAQTAQAQTIANLELDYINKNISMNQPQQNYIFNQIEFDQLFTLGTMLTPQGCIWKNPFSVGDWEYEKENDSFWQYQIEPIFISSTDSSDTTNQSSLQAENNSIFTEYYTSQATYTIAGTITLYNVSAPFFTGIIFNKSRWISGDFEAIRKCRMMGIYGQQNGEIGIYFAQQYTMNEAQLKSAGLTDPIQTPLQQIINQRVKPQITLPKDTCATLAQTPVIINFEITNSARKVDLKISINNNPAMTASIKNLDPSIYMYHGIGYICPGAIAQFQLTQPTDLIFTQAALTNYKE